MTRVCVHAWYGKGALDFAQHVPVLRHRPAVPRQRRRRPAADQRAQRRIDAGRRSSRSPALVRIALLFPEVRDGGVIREEIAWLPCARARPRASHRRLRVDVRDARHRHRRCWSSLYARYYMSPADPVPRFFSFFLAFMGAMLGVVLSGNLIQLVFFWELTSLFSFLLIGYWHHRARRAARRAHGADRHRRRRPVPARRRAAARPHRRQLRPRRGARRGRPRCARTRSTRPRSCWCCSARSPRARSSRSTSGCRTRWRRRRRCRPTCTRRRW